MSDFLTNSFTNGNVSTANPQPDTNPTRFPGSDDFLYTNDKVPQTPDRYNSVAKNLMLGAGSVVAGMVDTFGQSTFLLNDSSVEGYLKGSELGDFYTKNKDWARTVADLGTFMIPGTLGVKAIEKTGSVYKLAKGMGASDRLTNLIFTSGAESGTLLKGIETRASIYAKNTGSVDWSRSTGPEFWRQATSDLMKTSISDTIKRNVAFELGTAATMHSSDTLYPDDWTFTDHLMFNLPLPAAATGIEYFYLRNQLGRIAENAGRVGKDALYAGAKFDEMLGTSRAGARDVELSQNQFLMTKLDEAQKNGLLTLDNKEDQAKLLSNISSAKMYAQADRDKGIKLLGTDRAYPDVTTKFDVGEREASTVVSHLDTRPYDFLGVSSLEPIALDGRAGGDFLSARKGTLSSITREMKAKQAEAAAAREAGDVDTYAATNTEINKLRGKYEDYSKLTPVVLDPNGVKVDARLRSTLYQDYAEPRDISFPPSKLDEARRVFMSSTNNDLRGMEINMDTLSINFGKSDLFGKAEGGSYFLNGVDLGDIGAKYVKLQPEAKELELQQRMKAGDLTALTETQTDDETFYRMMSAQNLEQRSATYAMMEKYADKIARDVTAGELTKPISINPTRHYIYADFADALYKRLGDEKFSQWVSLPSNMKIDDVRFTGLAGKWRDYNIMMDVISDKSATGMKLRKQLDLNPVNFNYYANLPQTEPGKSSSILSLFNDIRMHSTSGAASPLKEEMENLNNLRAAANQSKAAPETAGIQTLSTPVQTTGDMLNWKPNENKSVLAVYRELPKKDPNTYQTMIDRAAHQRGELMDRMSKAGENGAIISQTVFDKLSQSAIAQSAMDIGSLSNGSQRGLGQLTTRALSQGDSNALRGMDAVDASLTPVQNKMIGDLISASGYGQAASTLRSDPVSLQNFADLYNSTRAGWDLEAEPVMQGDKALFKLTEDSPRNKRMWQRIYGEDMPEGSFMPGPTRETSNHVPFAATPGTLQMMQSVSKLADQIEKETNQILSMTGKGPITHRNFWIPSTNLANKDVSFIRHAETNELMYVASADNPKQLRQIAERTLAAYAEEGIPVREIPALKETNIFKAYDEAFDKLINFSDPLGQTAGIGGKQKGPIVISGEKVLEDVQRSVESVLQSAFRRNRTLFFEPYVNQVKSMDSVIESTARTKGLAETTTKKWLGLAYGSSNFDANSPMGKIYTGVEDFFDNKLAALQDTLTPGLDSRLSRQRASYEQYAGKLGEFNPYTDAFDYAQRTLPTAVPWTSKKVFGELNNLTTALTLRLFELGQPLLNMVSLAATMPAVTKAMMRQGNEDFAQWKRRIGPFASVISENQPDAVFNPLRVLTSGTHSYFNKMVEIDGKSVRLADWARDQGYFSQSVSDMLDTFVRPHQSQFRRSIGDLANILSKPADMSETFSRGISFHSGWELGESLGIKDPKNLASFSHDFANKVIGDYRPQNRPMMFQGAVGMPLGLFTTFMWNYNERLFKYIENKSTRAFYTQIATQASLFGANSVPGYSQYVNWFASNYDGSSNPVIGMENRFGTTAADWWHYGTLSNLPKLFGYGAKDGVAIYQRGDAGLKMVPTLFNPANTPVATSISKLYKATSEVVGAIRNNGVSPLQISQILAQNSISRPFRSAVELYNGYSIDNNQRVIDSDLHTTMGIISRVLGMKTLAEAKNTEAFYALGQSRLARSDRMSELHDTMSFNAREDKYMGPDGGKVLASDMREYLQNGGDPSGLAQMMRNNILMGHMDRTQAQSAKLLSGSVSSRDIEDFKRLQWAQMPTTNKDFEK